MRGTRKSVRGCSGGAAALEEVVSMPLIERHDRHLGVLVPASCAGGAAAGCAIGGAVLHVDCSGRPLR